MPKINLPKLKIPAIPDVAALTAAATAAAGGAIPTEIPTTTNLDAVTAAAVQ